MRLEEKFTSIYHHKCQTFDEITKYALYAVIALPVTACTGNSCIRAVGYYKILYREGYWLSNLAYQ